MNQGRNYLDDNLKSGKPISELNVYTYLIESNEIEDGWTIQKYTNQSHERRVLLVNIKEHKYIGYSEKGTYSNKWTVKVDMPYVKPGEYAKMQAIVISHMPDKHTVFMDDCISLDGIRNWDKQISKGYKYSSNYSYPFLSDHDKQLKLKELVDLNEVEFKYATLKDNSNLDKVKELLLSEGITHEVMLNENEKTVQIKLPDLVKI